MKNHYFTLLFLVISIPTHAEEYVCIYSWADQNESYSMLIDVQEKRAIIRGEILNLQFTVAANSPTELLIYQTFTKESSGTDYPVGFAVIAHDKKTKSFVYSNAFAGGNQNNYAIGSCKAILNEQK